MYMDFIWRHWSQPASHSKAYCCWHCLTSSRGKTDTCGHWEGCPVLCHLGLHKAEAVRFQDTTSYRCWSVITLEKPSPILELSYGVLPKTTRFSFCYQCFLSLALTYCSVKIHAGFFSFPYFSSSKGKNILYWIENWTASHKSWILLLTKLLILGKSDSSPNLLCLFVYVDYPLTYKNLGAYTKQLSKIPLLMGRER